MSGFSRMGFRVSAEWSSTSRSDGSEDEPSLNTTGTGSPFGWGGQPTSSPWPSFTGGAFGPPGQAGKPPGEAGNPFFQQETAMQQQTIEAISGAMEISGNPALQVERLRDSFVQLDDYLKQLPNGKSKSGKGDDLIAKHRAKIQQMQGMVLSFMRLVLPPEGQLNDNQLGKLLRQNQPGGQAQGGDGPLTLGVQREHQGMRTQLQQLLDWAKADPKNARMFLKAFQTLGSQFEAMRSISGSDQGVTEVQGMLKELQKFMAPL